MVSRELISKSEEVSKTLAMMANSKRLAILCHLMTQELSVGAIAQRVGLSQSALSQHLAKLRDAGLVETRRERQTIYYSCRSEEVAHLLRKLDQIYGDAA